MSRRFLEGGTKVRVSKKSGQIIEKPDPLANRMPRNVLTGPKDTEVSEVYQTSFEDYDLYAPHIYDRLDDAQEKV